MVVKLARIYCCKNSDNCCTERLHGEGRVSKVQKDSCSW